VTTVDSPPDTAPDDGSWPATGRGIDARVPALRPLSPIPTYAGVVVAALGFALIAVAWVQVAAQTSVALQLPYLVSGAVTGLALVMVGLTVISVAARRRDAALREQQTELLADALRELSAALENRPQGPRA
jgi:hypothetical protein